MILNLSLSLNSTQGSSSSSSEHMGSLQTQAQSAEANPELTENIGASRVWEEQHGGHAYIGERLIKDERVRVESKRQRISLCLRLCVFITWARERDQSLASFFAEMIELGQENDKFWATRRKSISFGFGLGKTMILLPAGHQWSPTVSIHFWDFLDFGG